MNQKVISLDYIVSQMQIVEDNMDEKDKFRFENSHLILKNIPLLDILYLSLMMVPNPFNNRTLNISCHKNIQREIIDNQSLNDLHQELTSSRRELVVALSIHRRALSDPKLNVNTHYLFRELKEHRFHNGDDFAPDRLLLSGNIFNKGFKNRVVFAKALESKCLHSDL